jgi:hypothetical protein
MIKKIFLIFLPFLFLPLLLTSCSNVNISPMPISNSDQSNAAQAYRFIANRTVTISAKDNSTIISGTG